MMKDLCSCVLADGLLSPPQVPDGSNVDVTAQNVREYVHLYASSRLNRALTAVYAMRCGLVAMVPSHILALLTAEDFWLILNGGTCMLTPLATTLPDFSLFVVLLSWGWHCGHGATQDICYLS